MGDVPVLRQSLEESETSLNVSCVDYMGRSALHLAIDNENTESIELLLDKLSFECIEESLLHAISKGSIKTVKMIIEHPSYMAGENKVTTEYWIQASVYIFHIKIVLLNVHRLKESFTVSVRQLSVFQEGS